MTLGSAMLLAGVCAVLAFMLAISSLFHLDMAVHVKARQTARNMAESAMAETVYNAMDLPEYGQNGETLEEKPRDGLTSIVTFNLGKASAEKVIPSFNNHPANVEETRPDAVKWPPGASKQYNVPTGAILVSAKAVADGEPAQGVAVVWFPQFPYAVASNGPVISQGKLLVAGSNPAPPEEAVKNATGRGSIASNSGEENAVELRQGAHVTGNAMAVGGVVLAGDAKVDGHLGPGSAPVPLPHIEVSELDPVALELPDIVPVPSTLTAPKMSGFNRAAENVTVFGDLELNDGFLYVNGNLQVTGRVTGHGVVVTTRDMQIMGGGNFSGSGTAALIAGGNLSISGDGAERSGFAGLLYAEGNFSASNISLVGAFVGGGPSSNVSLSDTSVIHVPDYTKVQLDLSIIKTSFSYDQSDSPVWMGGPGVGSELVKINWVKYRNDNGNPVYALTDTPDVPAQPMPQFYDQVARYMEANGMQKGALSGTWWEVKKLRSNTDGNWYPVEHFVQFLRDRGPVPKGSSRPAPPRISTSRGKLLIDLNRFLCPADRMRVLLWQVE